MNKEQQFPYVDLNSLLTGCVKNFLFIVILTLIGAMLGLGYYAVRSSTRNEYNYSFTYSVMPETSAKDEGSAKDDIEAAAILGKSYMQIFATQATQNQILSKANAQALGVRIESVSTKSEVVYEISVTGYDRSIVCNVINEIIYGMQNGEYGQIPNAKVVLPDSVKTLQEEQVYEIDNSISMIKPIILSATAFFVISVVIICLKVIKNGYITHPQVLNEVISVPIIGYAVTNVRRKGRGQKK